MASLKNLYRNFTRPSFWVSGRYSIFSLLARFSSLNSAPKANKDTSPHRTQSKWQKLQSWRVGVMFCALSAGFTFFVNLSLIIWASTKGFEGGIATIQEGDCNETKRLDLWLHLGINFLSTLLLGASNYTMQCLSAPTRDEISNAHRQQVTMDIGIPSIRNLRKISWRRISLWWLIALSSVPLHFMYNSAVFSTLSTRPYTAAVVSHDFVTGAPFKDYINYEARQLNINFTYVDAPRLTALRDMTCTQTLPYRCSSPTRNWTVLDVPIDYCLSQHIEPGCKLHFSLVIMVIVILCNFAKTVCMSLTFWKPSSTPLLTLGDVIASFLDHPDPNIVKNWPTNKFCFRVVKHPCSDDDHYSSSSAFSRHGLDSDATNDRSVERSQRREASWGEAIRTFKSERYRWYHSTSPAHWLLSIFFCTLTLVITGIQLRKGLVSGALTDKSVSHLWSLGYGGVSSETMIRFGHLSNKLIPMILLVNLPQAVLSFLYLTYNALFTSMLLAEEWSGFAHQRKTLRVTCPVGKQRSTFWLQLPYSYSIPLLIMSGILHWLVSQSIFLIRIAVENNYSSVFSLNNGGLASPGEELISTCGYSPIAIITVIPLGVLLLLVLIASGFRKYKDGMPLAGSSSAAISTACHRPKEDVDAAVLPVLWGAVSTEGPIDHCCFTSFEVSPPVKGGSYAKRGAMSSMGSGTAAGLESGQAGPGLRSRT